MQAISFIVGCALFILLTFYLTALYNKEFLIWASDISLFLPTRLFFLQNMQTAGGLLSYGGMFLTQFCYYPLLGSTILILLLLFVTFLVVKAFKFSKNFVLFAFIPALSLLLSVTEVGYILYSLKSAGYLFANILGTIVCLLSFCGYQKIKNEWLRIVLLALFILTTYPLFGFYSLFSALLLVLNEWKNKRVNGKERTRQVSYLFVHSFTCSLLILFVPYLYSRYFYTQMPYYETYTSGLPHFYFTRAELPLWTPFIVLFLSLLIFLVISCHQKKQSKTGWFASLGIFLLSLYGTYTFSYRNNNFKTELQMTKAIENNDWNKVISIGEKQQEKPTRQIIMYWNLALYKLGQAGDRMFEMDNNSMLPVARRQNLILMHNAAKPLYFQYGKINYCYRWCMEDMVEYSMTVQDLKYMVKCAIINKEFPLAQKYNKVLKQTLFHKGWAEQQQQYIDNPSLAAENMEMKSIRPLMAYQNLLDGDGNKLELYILNSFAYMEGGTPEIVEMSLQCNLILKNIERFWSRFFLYARTHERVPVHYQEAAILYSYLEGKIDASRLPLDKDVVEKFNRMVTMSKQYANMPEEYNRKMFKPQFGNTFWYYYFFVTDIKTN
ncbi:MAG: DUF6057 family protein [Dysgonamonadaceae bacterium]|nr:DUF6057 family protein [Dysgonamonadaceae bacterium]